MENYTQDQLADMGRKLARLQQELDSVTANKKATARDYKVQIDELKEAIGKLSAELDRGFPMADAV